MPYVLKIFYIHIVVYIHEFKHKKTTDIIFNLNYESIAYSKPHAVL